MSDVSMLCDMYRGHSAERGMREVVSLTITYCQWCHSVLSVYIREVNLLL